MNRAIRDIPPDNRRAARPDVAGRPAALPVVRMAPPPVAAVVAVLILGWLLAIPLAPAARAEKLEDLKPQGYVNDFAGVLDSSTRAQLTELCTEVDAKAQAQIAVVTIHTLDGAPIEDFANQLYARWGIGPKSNNRGVLILFAVNDHRYRVEVGYGLEPILPDGKVGGFGREMIPRLRAGDYSGAVLYLTGQIAQVIAQDRGVTLTSKLPELSPEEEESGGTDSGIRFVVLGLLLFGAFGIFLPRVFGSGRGGFGRRWGGPWIGGFGGGGFGGFGGFGGGGGGGGGGFGGFGGGISGGGGASGSW